MSSKFLIISPQAGFGNRIQALCSALVLGQLLGRKVYHAWLPETREKHLSHISAVRDMQLIALEDMFVEGLIPAWSGKHKVDTCYSEWAPGHFWFNQQSSAYYRFGDSQAVKLITNCADELLDCNATTILVESSHALILSAHRDEWNMLMANCYQTYFKALPRYIERLPARVELGMVVQRSDGSFEELVEWCRAFSTNKSAIIFSDDATFRTELCAALGIKNVESSKSDWEQRFVEFLTLTSCCDQLTAAATSSSRALAVLVAVPCSNLLEATRNRTLVLYAYNENTASREAIEYFMTEGMRDTSCETVEYWLLINGATTLSVAQLALWSKVILRENKGYDFGAWREGLQRCKLASYDYFICLNDTVKGPYNSPSWIPRFTSLITPTCLLSGVSINYCTYGAYTNKLGEKMIPHVQSMLWCTNRVGLSLLWELLMADSQTKKAELVARKELNLSLTVLKAGYNISCVLKPYQHDNRIRSRWEEYAKLNSMAYNYTTGDPWFRNSYFGRNLTPEETIFFKYNRDF